LAEVNSFDPARLEADIVGQLYHGTSPSFMGVDCVSSLVKDCHVRSLPSSSDYSASALVSSNVKPAHFSCLNNLVDQSSSVVVNPAILSVGSQYSLPVDLDLGVYGSVACDLPREVVRDALAVNLGARCGASVSGQGLNLFEHSENVWPLVSVAQSNDEDVVTPLAIDFSFLQNAHDSFSVEDIWDGENVDSGVVSKWVASKLKSIAATIGVAISGYESEVTQLLSRIEKNNVGCGVPKQSVQRTPPVVRRQRELRRLEFGVTYDRPTTSSSGMLVPYV